MGVPQNNGGLLGCLGYTGFAGALPGISLKGYAGVTLTDLKPLSPRQLASKVL